MSVEFPEIQCTINPKFKKRYPQLNDESFVKSMLQNAWNLPLFESNQYLPGMGTTRNNAMPTAFMANGKLLEVFAKICDPYFAKSEYYNTLEAQSRLIPVPAAYALVEMDQASIVLSRLLHNVEPLSARNLTHKSSDPRQYRPEDFLTDFVSFIANVHNKGLAHGDLHLGNIGFRFRYNQPPSPLLFDLEWSYLLDKHELNSKNQFLGLTPRRIERIGIFELMAMVDLGMFTAYLTDNGFPMGKDELLSMTQEKYETARIDSYGRYREMDFTDKLYKEYDRVSRQLNQV